MPRKHQCKGNVTVRGKFMVLQIEEIQQVTHSGCHDIQVECNHDNRITYTDIILQPTNSHLFVALSSVDLSVIYWASITLFYFILFYFEMHVVEIMFFFNIKFFLL